LQAYRRSYRTRNSERACGDESEQERVEGQDLGLPLTRAKTWPHYNKLPRARLCDYSESLGPGDRHRLCDYTPGRGGCAIRASAISGLLSVTRGRRGSPMGSPLGWRHGCERVS
jgi:hypothetical protein